LSETNRNDVVVVVVVVGNHNGAPPYTTNISINKDLF
jgi:hypothetical protein